ncbi:F-box protein, partial [Candidatus Bathyarchaeota archaeon]|nr:F-box protein [Candidatus Bathyarchaeota archaeon]
MPFPKLDNLPIEVRLDICHHLDIESAFNLAQVNRSFNETIESNKIRIVLPILQRDFSPFDELLQVFTASEEDLYTTNHTC